MSILSRVKNKCILIDAFKILIMDKKSYSSIPGISYRIANQSRYDDVQNLLYNNFHVDEPMSNALNMYDSINRSAILNQFAIDGLNENMSIIAIDEKTDKLLGVCINQTAQPSNLDPETELQKYLKEYDDPKFGHILRVLHGVNQNAGDLFKAYDTNIFFDIKMLATDKNNRKGGLAKDLLQRSVMLAKVLVFNVIKTEATGLYSRKAFERIGFHVNAEYLYSDYKDEESGEQIFASAVDPHRC